MIGIPADPSLHVCQLIGTSPETGFCSPKITSSLVIDKVVVVEVLIVVEEVEVVVEEVDVL
jgi:hypothetical protein